MENENYIKEKRTNEAIQKNLIGQTGKIYTVVLFLGEKIIAQPSSTDWNLDFYDLPDENEIPIFDETTQSTYEIGHYFNAYSSGMQFEIITKEHTDSDTDIVHIETKVIYKGIVVYHEINNELERYIPEKTWEGFVNRLFEKAKEKRNQYITIEKEKEEKMIQKETESIFKKLRNKWGI